ncbi:MAG: TIR domain-containing protein [Cyclobacteriaceae bacterium]|nr:TIR domain-containing protein [Cyclobacteriaceae bacterium]
MGRNIFVSYKYGDTSVNSLNKCDYKFINGRIQTVPRGTRVRDYVDELQMKIGEEHVNLGEKDGESLERFKDSTIQSELKKKIYKSSVTLVMISKGMKDLDVPENDQWIPWEISYSLRVVKREDSTSQMNAILGIVIPDENNSYLWYYETDPFCQCIHHRTERLFDMLSKNMFNIKNKKFRECNGIQIHTAEEPSFIKTITWDEFMNGDNADFYIEKAITIRDNAGYYDIQVNMD